MRNSDLATEFEPGVTTFSDTQKKKIHHLFNVLDMDRNGFLQPEDFVNVGQRIVDLLCLEQDSRAARLILLKSHRLFVQLLTDLNNPELSLTLWDWIEFFREQVESKEEGILDHYIQRTSRHVFDLFDINRDHLISKTEYSDMLTIYNLNHENVTQGFMELDENGDNFISVDEMVNGLRNFFRSSDPDAKGNLIFGEWR